MSAESGRRYWDEDVTFAKDLARRAALAIDNARLYREAQEANRIKDEFLATLSHELRTPLTAVLGWAELLASGQLDGESSERAIATIQRNANAQSQIIEDILDVSRIISGKMRFDPRPVELIPVIEAAMEAVRPAINAKAIQLESIFVPSASIVSGDPARLQQVIWNLLSNAVKFTSPGGRVEVRLEHLDASARITISASGSGWPSCGIWSRCTAAGSRPKAAERARERALPSTFRSRPPVKRSLARAGRRRAPPRYWRALTRRS
jgi:signal transduction histidine kinase